MSPTNYTAAYSNFINLACTGSLGRVTGSYGAGCGEGWGAALGTLTGAGLQVSLNYLLPSILSGSSDKSSSTTTTTTNTTDAKITEVVGEIDTLLKEIGGTKATTKKGASIEKGSLKAEELIATSFDSAVTTAQSNIDTNKRTLKTYGLENSTPDDIQEIIDALNNASDADANFDIKSSEYKKYGNTVSEALSKLNTLKEKSAEIQEGGKLKIALDKAENERRDEIDRISELIKQIDKKIEERNELVKTKKEEETDGIQKTTIEELQKGAMLKDSDYKNLWDKADPTQLNKDALKDTKTANKAFRTAMRNLSTLVKSGKPKDDPEVAKLLKQANAIYDEVLVKNPGAIDKDNITRHAMLLDFEDDGKFNKSFGL